MGIFWGLRSLVLFEVGREPWEVKWLVAAGGEARGERGY